MTARYLDCTPEEYHADPCAVPSLNATTAKVLLGQSPAHAHLQHPRLGGKPREASDEMDHGVLCHALLLGVGMERIEVLDVDDYRGKRAELRDAARDAGRVPIKRKHYEAAQFAVEIWRADLQKRGIFLQGDSEVAIEWTEGGTVCRGQVDHLIVEPGGITVYDLKTGENAHPFACSSRVLDCGYDLQHAAYISALEQLHPEHAGRIDFVFLFAETVAPFAVTPARIDGTLREYGRRRWERAVKLWSECLAAGRWPAYAPDGPVTLEPPSWLVARLEREAA